MRNNEANYTQTTLLNGNRLRKEGQENPSTFATSGGAVDTPPSEVLIRSLQLEWQAKRRFCSPINVKSAITEHSQQWNGMFAQSNQGFQFNQAKMLMAQGQQQSGKKEDGGKENA